jgi:tRNA-splicing ligase RtcB (3'-phosphate/5'-hydroxy nucleic acid ligase)
MQIIDNIPVWGAPVDDGALRQINTCYYIFGQAAMMADHHKGYGVPIGGVIAHENGKDQGRVVQRGKRSAVRISAI